MHGEPTLGALLVLREASLWSLSQEDKDSNGRPTLLSSGEENLTGGMVPPHCGPWTVVEHPASLTGGQIQLVASTGGVVL